MAEESVIEKFSTLIDNIVRSKSLHFMFYSMLYRIKRRLPFKLNFLEDVCLRRHFFFSPLEKHLYDYMFPKHLGCFVDVGAHMGEWTRYLAKQGYVVHAFEPTPDTIEKIRRNIKSYPNVHVYPFALGEQSGRAKLNLHPQPAKNKIVNKDEDLIGVQINVEVRTLDSLKIVNVGLIKIDTEGYEVPVLLGAKKTIQKDKPRLIIEVHKPFKEQMLKITAILKNYNYFYITRHKPNGQPHIIADVE